MFRHLMTMLSQLQIDGETRDISYYDLERVRQYAKAMQSVYHGQNEIQHGQDAMAKIEEEWSVAYPPKDQE